VKLAFRKVFLVIGLVLCLGLVFGIKWLDEHYIVPIIMYHHVDYQGHSKAITTSPERFTTHMDYLKRHKFNVISLEQLVEATINQRRLPRNSVVITFDDGYDDNYVYAYQTLKKYNFPATFFVAGVKVGNDEYMTWDQLREMIHNGYEIGSHTWNHQYLPGKERDLQVKEISGGKELFEKRLSRPVKFFSYPSGGFSERVKQMTKRPHNALPMVFYCSRSALTAFESHRLKRPPVPQNRWKNRKLSLIQRSERTDCLFFYPDQS